MSPCFPGVGGGWRQAARKGVEIEITAMRGLICCGLGLHHYDH